MKSSKSPTKANYNQPDTNIRIDKWLWACRFYKTRALAKAAIDGGKVDYQGHKCKPSRCVQLDHQVKLRQGFDEKTVVVKGLSERRQSASIAQTLYQETEESIQKRLQIAEMRKIGAPKTQGKPDKKQRRQIHRFKQISSD
ncbi:MAG: S4 domain-containing protein [Enterobacterales bacterium]|nr:S4 domain-containing protein [Enterobacterales bacterium]